MIQKAVDTLQVALQSFSFGKGIDSLPNEVLSMIFETYNGLGEKTSNLSLVSRQFRRIVLDSPRLWNSISNCGYTMSRIAMSLERSKETGLHVNLYLHESKDPFEIFSKLVVAGALNSALCHAKRWKTLRITMQENWGHAEESMLKMRRHLVEKVGNLPHLEELHLHSSTNYCLEANWIFQFTDFLVSPRLHRLYIYDFIPRPSMALSALTSLKLELYFYGVGPHVFRDLLVFIRSIPTLEDASLAVKEFEDSPDPGDEYPALELQILRKLEFILSSLHCKPLLPFRKALITPVISVITFAIGDADISDATFDRHGRYMLDWPDEFMFCHPTLEVLTITFDPLDGESYANYCIPFHKLPNLRELVLETPSMYPLSRPVDLRGLPALRSISVLSMHTKYHCQYWLQDIRMKLCQQGNLPELNKLTLHRGLADPLFVEKWFKHQEIKWIG